MGADHPNLTDRGLQLSRSFRALKVWMSVQTFGMAAFRRAVSKGMDLAVRAEEHVRSSPVLEPLNQVTLGVVCFRINPRRWRSQRGSGGRDQQDRARPHLLGRPRIHVIDASPRDICAQALHPQPHHDLGRCARDPGSHRALRERGFVEGGAMTNDAAHPKGSAPRSCTRRRVASARGCKGPPESIRLLAGWIGCPDRIR